MDYSLPFEERTIRIPGRPSSLREEYVEKPMQDISLKDYQGRIKRAVAASFANTGLLPVTTKLSIEIQINTLMELSIIAATKPILDALKKVVYDDDSFVRSLSVRVSSDVVKNKRGPDDTIRISIARESSVPSAQPHKTHSFLPISVSINAVPRLDSPPHSKEGKLLDAKSVNTEQALARIRESSIYSKMQPLEGDVMVSMKIKTNDRKLDLDNVAGLYLKAFEGIAFHRIPQVKFLYITFMDTDIFVDDEGVYLTTSPYDPSEW